MSRNAQHVRAFNADLKAFAKKVNINLGVAVMRIALDAFQRFSKRTPVDTGRARASWAISIGAPSSFIPKKGAHGKRGDGKEQVTSGITGANLGEGAASSSAAGDTSAAASIDGTKNVFVTSALDYMQFLEQGSSKQAPVGMVVISLTEMEVEIEAILEGIE